MSAIQGIRACVFDAYGTLFDFGSAVARCPDVPDDRRAELVTLWRDKQLQYTWLRSLQNLYTDFETVTADALDFALEATGLADPKRRETLLALYRIVSAYPEVKATLGTLKAKGIATAILSNGTPAMLAAAIAHAGIGDVLDHVLSVEAVGVFKTDPRVYQMVPARLGVERKEVCFVSSNGWDAYGASAFGFRVAWCNRAKQPAERLPGAPDAMIGDLSALPGLLGLG
jgi:2-haloacid dehalogenase